MFHYEDLSPTSSMVLRMLQKLPRIQPASYSTGYPANCPANHPTGQPTVYTVYMDNYFSTVSLFKALHVSKVGYPLGLLS